MMSTRFLHGECNEVRLRSFLDDRSSGDEIEKLAQHLDECESCRRTLERLAGESGILADLRGLATETIAPGARSVPKFDDLVALDFLAPSSKPGVLGRLGRYEVREVLGRGAFGVVLKAFDPELSRFVAIKVLAAHFAASAAARARFAREARAAAAVVHENVVAIHAVDSWNGLPYLVMPCIAGRSLQERVDRDGPLAVKEVLRVGMQAALGLAAAHEQGLVHRDVKPSNILLENGVERVKLSDFGLARAVDDASQTQSGIIAGTPQYMSPEQARGDAIDHRSDLFSLGSVLYFMCTGHPPFRADSTPAVLRRVCEDRPRPLRDVNPDIPAWLGAVVERLLAKDAVDRLTTAAEVAEILKRHLADVQRTGTSTPLVTSPVTETKPSRPRSRPIAAFAFALAIMAMVVFAGWVVPRVPGRGLAFLSSFGGEAEAPSVALAGATAPDDRIVGSGVPATKTWDVAGFTLVQIGAAFRAEITKGDAFRVATTSDDNVLEHLRVVKEGKTLKIGLEPNRSFELKEPLKAEIVLPVLEGLDASGASRVALKGEFRSDAGFKLNVSGASRVEGSIEAGAAEFHLSGASRTTLTGSAGSARINVSGASQLNLEEFPLKQCRAELSGASHAWLSVRSDQLFQAHASGASALEGTVEASPIALELDGASTAKLRGKAESATLGAAGASKLDLAKLTVGAITIKLSGASRAAVDARTGLIYDVRAASKLTYAGSPPATGKKSKDAKVQAVP